VVIVLFLSVPVWAASSALAYYHLYLHSFYFVGIFITGSPICSPISPPACLLFFNNCLTRSSSFMLLFSSLDSFSFPQHFFLHSSAVYLLLRYPYFLPCCYFYYFSVVFLFSASPIALSHSNFCLDAAGWRKYQPFHRKTQHTDSHRDLTLYRG